MQRVSQISPHAHHSSTPNARSSNHLARTEKNHLFCTTKGIFTFTMDLLDLNTEKMGSKTERSKHADTIIRNHIGWSMGAGMIPIPIADFFAVSAIQLDMVRQLCKLYEVDFKENEMKAIVTALTTSGFAKAGARIAIKLVPGIGTIIGGATMAILSGASSYAVGEVFKKHFETGGTILDFDMDRLRKLYNEKFEKGKKVVEKMNKKAEAEKKVFKMASKKKTDPADQLRKLTELKKEGIISKAEFKKMKKKIVNS
jgi:uncharacterized protein (DUF697 family)